MNNLVIFCSNYTARFSLNLFPFCLIQNCFQQTLSYRENPIFQFSTFNSTLHIYRNPPANLLYLFLLSALFHPTFLPIWSGSKAARQRYHHIVCPPFVQLPLQWTPPASDAGIFPDAMRRALCFVHTYVHSRPTQTPIGRNSPIRNIYRLHCTKISKSLQRNAYRTALMTSAVGNSKLLKSFRNCNAEVI